MSKYEKLDRLILNKIGGHPTPFHRIFIRDVDEEAKLLAEEDGSGHPFRYVDRRLQAMRKRGVIRNVTGKGWVRK